MVSASQIAENAEWAITQAALDEKIERLRVELTGLQRERNSLSPIWRLTDDILREIFWEIVREQFEEKWKWSPGLPLWTMSLLRVCHRWNRLVMETGRLWTFLSNGFRWNQGAVIMAERSKQCPLHCRLFQMNADCTLGAITVQNFYRIQSLELHGSRTEMTSFFSGLSQLPILRRLEMYCSAMDELRCILPSFISPEESPIHELHLYNVDFANIDHFLSLNNLTTLVLCRSPFPREAVEVVPSLGDFLRVLAVSPKLVHLEIHHYIAAESPPGELPRSIDIHKLDELHLSLHIDLIARFLKSTIITSWTTLRLVAYGIHIDCQPFQKLLVPLRRHFRYPGAPTLCSVGLTANEDQLNGFSICMDYIDRWLSNPDTTLFSLTFFPYNHQQLRKMLTKVLHAIPLRKSPLPICVDATRVHDDVLSLKSWRTFFQSIQGAVSVQIQVDMGMIHMLRGLIAAMPDIPKTRRQRHPYRFEHSASHRLELHAFKVLPQAGSESEEVDTVYDQLLEQLQQYYTNKPGRYGPNLSFGSFENRQGLDYVRELCAELQHVVAQIILEGTCIHLASNQMDRVPTFWGEFSDEELDEQRDVSDLSCFCSAETEDIFN
ncbi:hypothetical protein C8J56DRAFT_961088 [Mycena floridula]|nr:hypothetical protein C8J56DRAFT_961088 [Mycena floridula]